MTNKILALKYRPQEFKDLIGQEIMAQTILNAIKFKLFIPKTRKGDNEILGTVISRKLGFITPETFELSVNVNNINSPMIFQEDSRKEMLERNKRREGPIFEGDEYFLWSQDGWDNFDLEDISLVKLINSNWFWRWL